MHPKSPVKRTVSIPLIVAAALCFLCGAGLFVYYILTGISGLTGQLLSARVPGEVVLTLPEPGSYTVFHEYTHGFEDGVRSASDSEMESLQLTVVGADGKEIALQRPSGTSTYNVNGRSGYSLYWFEVDKPGEYTLSGAFPEARNGPAAMLTLSNNFGGKLIALIANCFAAIGFPGLIGVILLIMAFRKPK